MRLPGGSMSRRSHGAGAFAPSRWTLPAARRAGQAGVGWRSIGRSPTAIRLKNNGGGHRRGRPCLVGRAMTVTDHAAALFFRAVARDRHPTPACTASRTLRAYEKCFTSLLWVTRTMCATLVRGGTGSCIGQASRRGRWHIRARRRTRRARACRSASRQN